MTGAHAWKIMNASSLECNFRLDIIPSFRLGGIVRGRFNFSIRVDSTVLIFSILANLYLIPDPVYATV